MVHFSRVIQGIANYVDNELVANEVLSMLDEMDEE
jgi:hypothetical protein